MTIDPHILRILSHWGMEPQPAPAPEDQDVLKGYASMAHELGRAAWKGLGETATQEELVRLIRGMVRAEEAGLWWGGSVSMVVTLFACYAARWPQHRLVMADWIMANSTNDYAPYGSGRGGAQSHEEYDAYLRSVADRRAAKKREQEDSQIRGEEQRIERAKQHGERLQDQERELQDRTHSIQTLEQLPIQERLLSILADEDHALAYYPLSLVAGQEEAIAQLDPTLIERVRRCITTDSDREWMRWARTALNASDGPNTGRKPL